MEVACFRLTHDDVNTDTAPLSTCVLCRHASDGPTDTVPLSSPPNRLLLLLYNTRCFCVATSTQAQHKAVEDNVQSTMASTSDWSAARARSDWPAAYTGSGLERYWSGQDDEFVCSTVETCPTTINATSPANQTHLPSSSRFPSLPLDNPRSSSPQPPTRPRPP